MPPSTESVALVSPTGGWWAGSDVRIPLGSLTSGQNCWVVADRLRPRFRLQRGASNNVLGDVPVGVWQHYDVEGVNYLMAASQDTVALLSGGAWSAYAYASGASNNPPTGGATNLVFAATSYLTRRDLNITAFTNGVDPIFCTAGPTDANYSTLTGGPICADVCEFQNRLVAWNCAVLNSSARYLTRAQWCTAGGPEDWAGVGSGYEDLVDMRGTGTRVFSEEERMVLASDREIWQGRAVGLPFVHQFAPLSRTVGIPFANAAIQTPYGLFWLNDDYMVYTLNGSQVQPVGQKIQETLRRELADFSTAFFSYLPQLQQLNFYYATTSGAYPQHAFTLHLNAGLWTPQRFAWPVARASMGVQPSSGTTWGGLSGTLGSQPLTYAQLLGASSVQQDFLFSSRGTDHYYSTSAISDDGSTMTQEALMPGFFTDTPTRLKLAHEVRLEVAADTPSRLTAAWSGDNGCTFSTISGFAISARSDSTQVRIHPNIPTTFGALRLTSESTGVWELSNILIRGRYRGGSF